MSILIKDMEMPTQCQLCPCSDDESRYCRAANKYIPMFGKPKFCPLVYIPPHGRLIDADALANEMRKRQENAIDWLKHASDHDIAVRANGIVSFIYEIKLTLDKQPTIIEAEQIHETDIEGSETNGR